MLRRTLPLVLLAACKSSTPDAPGSMPASAPASQPASHPASRPAFFGVLPADTASVAASKLRAHVFTLADDALEGRGPDTKGIHLAADYLEEQLVAQKLRPAFGDRFRQPFTMTVAIEVEGEPTLSAGRTPFAFGRDFAPLPFSSSGAAEGAIAFLGFGVSAEDLDYDDYAGIDVKDRIVVVMSGEPGDEDDKSVFDGRRPTRHSFLRTKALVAREAGAKALLIVRDEVKDDRRFDPTSDAALPTLGISKKTARSLLGFDVAAKKKAIDRSYRPESRLLDRTAKLAVTLKKIERTVENVGAKIPGSGEGAVVVGAHYDHLGYGGSGSLSGTTERRIHNGADDNASGTAVVLEVARAIAALPVKPTRTIYFVLFAGEESGLLGSSHFVKNSPVATEDVAAMINLDMVGRLRDEKLNIMGTKTASDWDEVVTSAVARYGFVGSFGGDGYGPSDHTSFYAAGVPVLFLFTGAHGDYHKPSDDPDTLDYQGMARIGGVVRDLVFAFARSSGRPSYVHVAAPAPAAGHGYGPYFGSIPDFGEGVDGVLLAGVREGSPADRAGVKKGDVLVEFGGVAVHNLQDFTMALRRCAPGDEVVVKVRRGDETIAVDAKLEKRGG